MNIMRTGNRNDITIFTPDGDVVSAKRIQPTSAPRSVGEGRLASCEDISKATKHLFGASYEPDPNTTQMMIDLLLRQDTRGNVSKAFAKDDAFAPYLVDMITGYRKLLTNGTIKHIFEFTMARVDWQQVANTLKQESST